MSHANAVLTPRTRLRLAQLVAETGYPVAVVTRMFMVSTTTARKRGQPPPRRWRRRHARQIKSASSHPQADTASHGTYG